MPTLTTTTLGRFCRELAGGLDDIGVLLKEWDVRPEEFAAIQETPAFIAEMEIVQAEMREMGNDAGYVYRMKSLSEQAIPEIVGMMTNKEMLTAGQRFEVIKWIAEMARLKEKPVQKSNEFTGPRGPTVVFKFGAGLPIQSMTVSAGEAAAMLPPEIETRPAIDVTPVDASGWPV